MESTKDRRYDGTSALKLIGDVSNLYAAKGKKVIHFDLGRDDPEKSDLTGDLLGPSGFLRAPAARKGKSFMVGFDEKTYRDLFV